MAIPSNLISPDKGTPSRLGLYANQLPGVTLDLFDSLAKDEQDDFEEFYNELYERAWRNFVNDCHTLLADKFHVDLKLVTRETSKFLTSYNDASELAGVRISYEMPKYARIHIISIEVDSEDEVTSPEAEFYVKEGVSGRLLDTITSELSEGRNVINVDQDFEVEDEIFVGYDPTELSLKKTTNRYYDGCTENDKLSCTIHYYDNFEASVFQIRGGGINLKFNIYCSIEKFLLENINLFSLAFWYRIGIELMIERRLSDKWNRWTSLTTERANELMTIYQGEYDTKLKNSIRNLKSNEDITCFVCKGLVSKSTQLP